MRDFDLLKAVCDYQARHLDFLKTREDQRLLCEIAWHEAHGTPLTVKQVFLLGLASVPTVQRRLARLRRLGVIQQRRCENDRRSVELTLAPRTVKLLDRYLELMRGGPAASSAAEVRVIRS